MTLGLPNAKPLTRRAFYSAATGKGLKKKITLILMVQNQSICKQVDFNIIAKFGDSHSWLEHMRYEITVRIVVFQRIAQVFSVLIYGTTNTDDI